MKKLIVSLVVLVVIVINPVLFAVTTDFNDGDTHTINYETFLGHNYPLISFRLDYEIANPPSPGTHVDLVNGGSVYNLTAYNNASITMTGGLIENDILLYDNTSFFMSSGSIKDSLQAFDTASVNINGGLIKDDLRALGNSKITMTGGTSANSINAYHHSEIFFADGLIMDQLSARQSASIIMSGGIVENEVFVRENGTLIMSGGISYRPVYAHDNGTIYLKGTDFQVNGTKLHYGDKLSDFGQLTMRTDGEEFYASIITGTLADGSMLNNEFRLFNTGLYEGTGDIIIIPEPCSLLLLGLGGLMLRKRKA